MKQYITLLIILLVACSMVVAFAGPASSSSIVSNIRVLHASSGPEHLDPGIRDLEKELRSVFRYTSYRLLQEKRLNLDFHTKGRVPLPGNRVLEVLPIGSREERIRFRISISKEGKKVFGTQILLRNGSSITIGGPKLKDGFLLFNISGDLD